MNFNLNNFLLAVSSALDFVEIDLFGRRTNHSKRVAYISLKIADKLGFKGKDLYDIVSLAILHDNGVCETNAAGHYEENKMNHCLIGEKNITNYPFFKNRKNVIKYHHEKLNGTGFFKLAGNEIPIFSQIICISDYLENEFNCDKLDFKEEMKIENFIKDSRGMLFSKDICDILLELLKNKSFKLDLGNTYIEQAISYHMPNFSLDTSLDEIISLTDIFSKIIDSKSKFTRRHSKGISEKAKLMAKHFNYSDEESKKLIIAANLHDLGKLAVPNRILDAERKLTLEEFDIIKCHTYYTRAALSKIDGFKDITEWASNHHEKLDGSGYPYGKNAHELDFNSRLMACIDIYQALTEDRPYRSGLEHSKAIEIMRDMVSSGFIDSNIVDEVNAALVNF